MKNKFISFGFTFFVLIIINTNLFSQAQLILGFIEANNNGDSRFGTSVSTAGDVNNDGFDDVIVGANGYNSYTGRAYIFYGGSAMDNNVDVTLTGEASNSYFGYSVSLAGDVNNDGFGDVLVGAYNINYNTGSAYIYYGGSAMDDIADVTMSGEDIYDNFGFSVSDAGDVNNDNYDDVIVGAFDANSAYIFYGGNTMDNIADVTLIGEVDYDNFGWAVSTSGDVNNDGYDDIIVGANGYNSSAGRAYIYYGGSAMDIVADVIMTEAAGIELGYSVSCAGDVNNDGYDDAIVGASTYGYYTGQAFIYYGGSSMNNVADVTMTGEATLNYFGSSVSTAGDVNNDNYDDVVIGAYGNNSLVGQAYIFYGGSSMDNIPDVTITGEGNEDKLGRSVSNAGDVDNDGFSDVIIGAYNYNWNNGRTYIYKGAASMNNIADVTITGAGDANLFGQSVSSAGDVNNDGYDDLIVGAYGYDSYRGRAYIYYGGIFMDNNADVVMTGEELDIYFGVSVSSAGDVNNDGFDDVIIGANFYNSLAGRAYVYYGGSLMDNVADVTMTGAGSGNYLGTSVSGAGDVNNDGYADIIVGAYGYAYKGRALIYYGGASMDNIADVIMDGEANWNNFGWPVATAGDVNNDGYDDVIVGAFGYSGYKGRAYLYYGGSSMNNVVDVTMDGEDPADHFGQSVSTAGDVNNDGYDDVIVGAPENSSFTGRAYIYYGGGSMNNVPDVTMNGEEPNSDFGMSVSIAGDVNNDGYDDVIVGAYGYNSSTGRAYIFYGGSSMDNTFDITMDGEDPGDFFGYSVSNAGDIFNDGYPEVIVGAYECPANGKVYLYSIDVSESIELDLTAFLEGPYNGTNMNTNLISDMPLSQPFTGTPWNYAGSQSVSAIPGTDIVDWVLIDIRDAVSADAAFPETSIGMQAAFLRNDGIVVDLDGNPQLTFENASVTSNLFVVLFPRNHIPVISANAITQTAGTYTYNFSTGETQARGGANGHKDLGSNVWGMFSGNSNGDFIVNDTDKVNWMNEAGLSGYLSSDVNMDGQAGNKDKNDFWLPNYENGSFVPQ